LIQLGKYNRAIEFISSERQEWQSTTSFVSEHIENFVVGGILVGKIGKCRELGIDFVIDPHSTCGENSTVGDQILVTVIGNLLENAIEAVRSLKEREPLIEFSVFDESGQIMISVKDNGKGIEEEIRDKIFQRGFSTKRNSGRSSGYGLYSIRMMVEALKGDIFLDSLPGEYTEFVVTLPNGGD
jgi:sensor histidine kinase regulating citrate/malate metabolism